MNKLLCVLKICFGFLAATFIILLIVYFIKFSGGISDSIDNWLLFISICNLGFISILTGLNVWVFYRLTSMFAYENKLSRSENAILDLRLSDYKKLRAEASKIKIAILKNEDFEVELNKFMQTLYSMSLSPSFSTTTLGKSVLIPIVEKYEKFFSQNNKNGEELMKLIDSSMQTIEVVIFTNQLRDDRLLKQIRKHPNWFDSTLISIDEFIKNTKLNND